MKILNLPLNGVKNRITSIINKFDKRNTQYHWILKRIMLHIVWGALNILGVICFSNLITSASWEYFFLIVGVGYCLMYWIIASKIFDKLIGDEIDNLGRWKR